MTTISRADTTAQPALSLKLLGGGLIAGMVMGMWQMVMEAVLPNGNGLWSPLVYIAATLMRNLQNVAVPVPFDLVAVFIGLMGHMMNSIILGLVFTWLIAPRTSSLMSKLAAGMVYGVAIFALMWFAVLPLIDPVMLRLNALIFFIAHLMYGAALALLSHWASARA